MLQVAPGQRRVGLQRQREHSGRLGRSRRRAGMGTRAAPVKVGGGHAALRVPAPVGEGGGQGGGTTPGKKDRKSGIKEQIRSSEIEYMGALHNPTESGAGRHKIQWNFNGIRYQIP